MSPETYQIVLGFTTLFLILVFLAAEIASHAGKVKGRIIRFAREEMHVPGLTGCRILVEKENGERVWAEASGCVACQGNFKIGDEIKLVSTSGGYKVMIPFFSFGNGSHSVGRGCSL